MSEPLHESANQASQPIGEHAWAAERIASYVAAGLATTDRLRMFRHLQSCEECRRAVAELQMLDEEMRQLFADVHPSADLETRTVQAVRREPRRRSRARRAAWSGPMKAMLVAAAVMLLIGVGAFLSESPKFRVAVAGSALEQEGIAIHNFHGSMHNGNNLQALKSDFDGDHVEGVRSLGFSNDWSDSDLSYSLERRSDVKISGTANPNEAVGILNGEPAATTYYQNKGMVGLNVPSDGRSNKALAGVKAGETAEFYSHMLQGSTAQGSSDRAPQVGLGTGTMAPWDRSGGAVGGPAPGGGLTPGGQLQKSEKAEQSRVGGGSGPGAGFGGGGFGFGNGRGVQDDKQEVAKDLADKVKDSQHFSINLGDPMNANGGLIGNTMLGGRSVTSSTATLAPATTNGSAATNWSAPVPGLSIPKFSDATGSPNESKASGGDKRLDQSGKRMEDLRAGAVNAPLFQSPAQLEPPAKGPGRDKVGEIRERLGKLSSEVDVNRKSAEPSKKEPTAEKLPQAKDSPAGDVKEPATPKEEGPAVGTPPPAPPALPVVAQQPPEKSDPLATQPPTTQPLATQHRKIIIRSGEMEFEIDSFDAAVASIVHIISTTKDGFVATVNSEKLANGKMRGSVVVRMPPERLDDFVLELRKTLAKTGDLKGQHIGSQDVTKHYTDLESELKAHRTMESRLLDILKNGKGAVKDLLAVEKDLGVYREKIEKIEGELRYYANLAALSTLSITLQEKEIRAAAAYTETERVNTGIEVEDVEKAYQEAQLAVREMKGRISQAEMKQAAAGQFNAKLVFEIAPEQAGPMRDRLRQLGNMVRLEMDRVQKIENGGEPTKDGKIRRGDTEFIVSIYNLANVEPRETTTLILVAADVPAAYQKLRTALAKLKTTMRDAGLKEQDKSTVIAGVDFDVRRIDEPAAQQALDAAGEVVARQSTRRADASNLTDAKVRFNVLIKSTSTIEPRETIHRLIAVPDVAAAYRRVQEAVTAKEMQAQMKVAALQQSDRNNVAGTLDFVVRRSDEAALRKLVDELGETLTRQSDQKLGDGYTDAKVRYDIRFIPETAVVPRDVTTARLAATDVAATYRKLRTLVEGLKGQIRGEGSSLNDRLDVTANLDVVVAVADEAAVQSAFDDLGEVLKRTTVRNAEGERVTNAKVEFKIDLVSAAKEIAPRKTIEIQMVVDKVEERMADFDAAVVKAGGRVVAGPIIDVKKNGGVYGEAVYDVPLTAADGLARRIRDAGTGEKFTQKLTENGTAPEGKLALARIIVRTETYDRMVPRENGFDQQLRYGLSVALSWLITSVSWLISGLVFFLPWVIVIGVILLVVRMFRRTPVTVPMVASAGETAATPPAP